MDSLEADYIKKMRKHDAELANGWGQIATPFGWKHLDIPQKRRKQLNEKE